MPGSALADDAPIRAGARVSVSPLLFAHQQFGRPQALEFGGQRGRARRFHEAKAPGTQFEPGEAEALAVTQQGGKERRPASFQQRVFRHGARRDDAHHLPLDRPLGFGRVADLLADGHGLSAPQEPSQVSLDAVHRHAGHRNGLTGRLAARGERDVQQRRRAARIAIEQLVEIAHAVEQQGVGMLRLDAQVLLHNGRVT